MNQAYTNLTKIISTLSYRQFLPCFGHYQNWPKLDKFTAATAG
jgi:hypothetical protein